MILIAILLPWLSFFLRQKIVQGILCLVLQITIIGWLPAAIWAVTSRNEAKMKISLKQAEKNIIDANKRR